MKRVLLKAYIYPKEKAEVEVLAMQAHVTVSELVRRLVTGRKLPATNLHQSVRDLIRINADLARLGNLLRMALDDPDFRPPENVDLDTLFDRIRDTQSLLKAKIEEL